MLLQEPPINFSYKVLATWAATVKHDVWPCSEAILKHTEMRKVFTTANMDSSAPSHRGKGSWLLHTVTSWVNPCLCLKLQLSSAKFKGDKCAPFKPDWHSQLGTDESPEPRKIQNIHKSCWEQQVTQALHLIGQDSPSIKPTGFFKCQICGLGLDRGNEDYKLHPKFCRQSMTLSELPGKGYSSMQVCKHAWGPGFMPHVSFTQHFCSCTGVAQICSKLLSSNWMENNFPFSSAKLKNNTRIISGTNRREALWTLKNFSTFKQQDTIGI